jgi:hypothetical protein
MENAKREQTERRMVKYGQVEVSRPCCKISASVQMPGAKIFSFGMSFIVFHPSLSDGAVKDEQ